MGVSTALCDGVRRSGRCNRRVHAARMQPELATSHRIRSRRDDNPRRLRRRRYHTATTITAASAPAAASSTTSAPTRSDDDVIASYRVYLPAYVGSCTFERK